MFQKKLVFNSLKNLKNINNNISKTIRNINIIKNNNKNILMNNVINNNIKSFQSIQMRKFSKASEDNASLSEVLSSELQVIFNYNFFI